MYSYRSNWPGLLSVTWNSVAEEHIVRCQVVVLISGQPQNGSSLNPGQMLSSPHWASRAFMCSKARGKAGVCFPSNSSGKGYLIHL